MSAEASVAVPAPSDGSLVPPSYRQTVILARYQFRDYLRSRRFLLMMGIVVAAGAIITAALAYFRHELVGVSANALYGGAWAGGVVLAVIFSGIIYGGDAIAGEFQNRTGYFLLGLPVRRAAVYAGKFVAAYVASVVAVVGYFLIIFGNAVYYLGSGAFSDPGPLLASFGLVLLYLLAQLGTVFLFSSLFKQSLYGVLVVAVLFLFGFTLLQTEVVALLHIEPWFVLTYAEPVLAYPFGTAPPHTVQTPGGTVYSVTTIEGIGIMVGYFLLTSLLGLLLFEREEFT